MCNNCLEKKDKKITLNEGKTGDLELVLEDYTKIGSYIILINNINFLIKFLLIFNLFIFSFIVNFWSFTIFRNFFF